MQRIIERFNSGTGHHLSVRAGVNTGNVISGLVGRSSVIYDMWGAAVNLAHQMRSGATESGIYVTSEVYEVMRDIRQFTPGRKRYRRRLGAADLAIVGAQVNAVDPSWLYWAVGLAIGLPVAADQPHRMAPRSWRAGRAHLARPVNLLRSYLVPLAALLVLLVKVAQVPAQFNSVRVLATVFGFVVLLLLLSGLNATVFEGAPQGSWRKRVPTIFRDVTRFLLIAVGLALIFSYVWGVRVGGLFTALGVTSVVIGLMLQNSVGQIVSGLFMLFEQPFRIGDWLDTPAARGRIVEANWRAVHIQTGHGLQITPNSVLAATSFTNLSRPPGAHQAVDHDHVLGGRPARPGAPTADTGRHCAAATQSRRRTRRHRPAVPASTRSASR